MQESVGERLSRRTRLEGASAARDPPRVFDAVEPMIYLLGVADSTTQWEMAARSFLGGKVAASHQRKTVVEPRQAVPQDLLLVATAAQTHQKEASQEEHRREQLTRAQKPLWKMMRPAGICTRYPSFCSLYTSHLESDCIHCIGSEIICVSGFLLVYDNGDWPRSGLLLTLRFLQ